MARWLLSLSGLAVMAAAAPAHFTMLLPDKASVKRGEEVVVTLQYGHPFEHELTDADPPKKFVLVDPAGKVQDLTGKLEKVSLPGANGKPAAAFRVRFTPEMRGDHVFVAEGAPRWDPEGEEFEQDTAQVVVHVQAQKGWDAVPAGEGGLRLEPLTRPYGLLPGMVFQARAVQGGKPAARAGCEVERYNAAPPKELPPDEHVTRTMKTDPNGVVTCTLTEPGWWAIGVATEGGKREREGKTYPVRQRAILWVHVDEKR